MPSMLYVCCQSNDRFDTSFLTSEIGIFSALNIKFIKKLLTTMLYFFARKRGFVNVKNYLEMCLKVSIVFSSNTNFIARTFIDNRMTKKCKLLRVT